MPRAADIFWTSSDVGFPMIGGRAKELRLARGLSIRQLANRAGVNKNTVLRLERGHPVSQRVLLKVCRSLDAALPDLTSIAPVPTRIRVFRAAETEWVSAVQLPEAGGHLPNFTSVADATERERYGRLRFTAGFLMTHACTIANGKMHAAVYEVHHPWTGGGIHHPGEEFVYCLRGEVCAMVGEEKHLLGPGDSISFDSSLVHNFERVTPPPAPAPQVLSVWIDGAPARAPDATPIRSSST